jgi:hypothetical protein
MPHGMPGRRGVKIGLLRNGAGNRDYGATHSKSNHENTKEGENTKVLVYHQAFDG